jgi:DNA primase
MRHSDRLIYCFDGDNAGRKAAWRALENTLESLQDGKEVSFLFLPEGEDPDSFIRSHGREVFMHQLDAETVPLSAFLVRELARDRKLDTQEGRAAFLKEAKPLLDRIAAPLLSTLVRRQIADIAGLQPDELAMFGLTAPRALNSPVRTSRRPAPSRMRSLARSLLMNPQRAAEIEPAWLDPADPMGEHMVELLAWLKPQQIRGIPSLAEAARGSALEPLIEELMAELLDKDQTWDWNAEFDGVVRQLRDDWRRRRLHELAARPLASLNADERHELAQLAHS